MKSASENDWDAYKRAKISRNCTIRRAKLKYYCGKLNENIGDPKTVWKMLNDLIGKKSVDTEIDEILTWSTVTLNSAHISQQKKPSNLNSEKRVKFVFYSSI